MLRLVKKFDMKDKLTPKVDASPKAPSSDAPESPCIRSCCLDNKDICLGCFRHIDEILAWQKLNAQQKTTIINTCDERRKAR